MQKYGEISTAAKVSVIGTSVVFTSSPYLHGVLIFDALTTCSGTRIFIQILTNKYEQIHFRDNRLSAQPAHLSHYVFKHQ
mgnify:CR=1 FL=1